MASQNKNSGSSTAQQARERARQVADRQSRKSSGAPVGLIAGIVALVVIIGVIIGLVVWQNNKAAIPEAGPVPASANQYGGITITEDGIPQNTSEVPERDIGDLPEAPETPDTSKTPPGIVDPDEAQKNDEPVQLVIFQDFECPHCAEFSEENGQAIQKAVDAGDATVEYRNLNFLDGTTRDQYSSRAATAAYLVAEQVTPDQYLDFEAEVLSRHGSGGLSNEQLAEIAGKHGADLTADRLDENTYRPMVDVASRESLVNGIAGTPTVFVDGSRYEQGDFSKTLKDAVKAKDKASSGDAKKTKK